LPRHNGKTADEAEIEEYTRRQAEDAVLLQRTAQAGAEMENWVRAGHLEFLKSRVLDVIECEKIKKVKDGKLTAAIIPQFAAIQAMLNTMDDIGKRVEKIIEDGKAAVAILRQMEREQNLSASPE
jgi:hypothetical protein